MQKKYPDYPKSPESDSTFDQNDFTWAKIECRDTGKRVDHSSVLFKDQIITFGGFNGQFLNDIIAFDVRRFKWKTIQPTGNSVTPRCGHTICLSDANKIVVFGGRNEEVLSEFGIMTLKENVDKSNRSSQLAKPVLIIDYQIIKAASENSPKRTYHTSIIHENNMYVFAGKDKAGESTNQLWSLDLKTYNWKLHQISGRQPDKRYGHCCVLYKDAMYVFGGHSTQDKTKFKDIWKLDFQLMKWEKIGANGAGPSPRSGASAQERDGKVYIFGGYKDDAECTNELLIYDIDSNTWDMTRTNDEGPTPRCYHKSICVNDSLFVWGGYDGNYLSDLYSLALPRSQSGTGEVTEYIVKAREGHPVMKKLFTDKKFADVVLIVENEEIPAHRAILAERCRFFDNMFTSGMAETTRQRIKITDINPITFKAFVEFLYCDEIKVNEELALDLLKLGDKYLVNDLKSCCERALTKLLKMHNFFVLAETAEMHGATKLKEAVLEFAAKNSKEIAQNEELTKLPKTILVEIIGKFASKLY